MKLLLLVVPLSLTLFLTRIVQSHTHAHFSYSLHSLTFNDILKRRLPFHWKTARVFVQCTAADTTASLFLNVFRTRLNISNKGRERIDCLPKCQPFRTNLIRAISLSMFHCHQNFFVRPSVSFAVYLAGTREESTSTSWSSSSISNSSTSRHFSFDRLV